MNKLRTILALMFSGVDATHHSRLDRLQEALRAYHQEKLNSDHGRRADERSITETNKAWPTTSGEGGELHPLQEVDDATRKRHMLVNHITSMSFLERIVMDDSETCRNETDSIPFLSKSIDDPFWFYYLGYYNYLGKDFSSYFTGPDENGIMDFSGMLEHITGPCQLFGGVVYSVSLNQTCSDGHEWYDTNVPICLGPSCILDENSLKDNENLNYCGDDPLTFDTQITRMESLVSEECNSENEVIRETSGFGDPDFIYKLEDEDVWELYCTDEFNSTKCDFSPIIEEYREPCENQGGTLYTFSDEIYATEGYYGDGPYVGEYKNTPVCIGVSCHAKNYFDNLIFPYFQFVFDGDFYQEEENNNTYYEPANYTFRYSSTYTPVGYAPVLETENPYSKFLLKSQVIDDEPVDTTKQCKWLSKKPSKQKEKICSNKRYQVYSEQSGVGPASLVCVDTCAPYCHKQKENAKFIHYKNDNGLVTKQCRWLKKQTADIIDAVCGAVVDVSEEETIYGQAGETCTTTCGSC